MRGADAAPERPWRTGLTLVEVLVALVILELGVLGASGLLVLAARTMTRAERIERAVAASEAVADSLSAADVLVDGVRALERGDTVVWTAEPDGAFRVRYAPARAPGVGIVLLGRRTGR